MKFAVFALALCLMLPVVSYAGGVTRITADSIKSDSVWSGRVLVEKPFKVEKGATLTIKPGAEVRFKKGAGLTVEGVLKASGSKGSPIVFTSDEKTPAPGDWQGISLSESGKGTALKKCVISYAAASVSIAVSDPPVSNCEIKRGSQGIVLARKTTSRLEANNIHDMKDAGISCQMGAAPKITGNTINKCGPVGITSSQDSAPVIKGNTISGCETGVGLSRGVPPIENNLLKDNKTGIFLSTIEEMTVRGNRFTGNNAGLVCQQFSNPVVEKNEFTGNTDAGLVCFRASSPLVRNNNFSKNNRAIACIQLCNPKITANNIFGNKKGVYLDLSSYALVNGNNIYDNDVEFELGNMSSDWEYRVNKKPERGSQAQNIMMANRGRAVRTQMGDGAHIMGFVDATGNWWGQAVTTEMEAKGPEANIKSFIDYYDVPTRTYDGYPGTYTQDKIKYEGWKKSRIKGAGF